MNPARRPQPLVGPGVAATAPASADHYPVFLDLRGQRCVVLGGGSTATGKARGLLRSGALVTVVALDPHLDLEHLADAGQLTLVHRAYRVGDLARARLAIDATGSPSVNERSRAEAERSGCILNVVDRPHLCHFIAPAVVRRGPLQVAISTGGSSPFLAGALRARLEGDLGHEWGELVTLVGDLRRRLRQQRTSPAAQTRAYRALLRPEVRRLLREGQRDGAEAMVSAATAGNHRGRVSLVGAGPGDPGLLTLAGRELLACADAVFHDALVSPETLALAPPHARRVDVGKRGGLPSALQAEITAALVEAVGRGEHAVRLKGGDPFVFGRGGEEMESLLAAGVEVTVVPGVSASTAAPALAGIPLTRRGVASSFAVLSGHTMTGALDEGVLEKAAGGADTLVVLMPMGHLDSICDRLAAVRGPEHPAALVAGASLPTQETVRASLSRLPQAVRARGLRAPATLLVGEVVVLSGGTMGAPRAEPAAPVTA